MITVVSERNAPIYSSFSLKTDAFPTNGLARIQFEGPWCKPGVPLAAAYKHTHWVGSLVENDTTPWIFDVNSGWTTYGTWRDMTMPDLTSDIKRATGKWHVTHRWQLVFQSDLNRKAP
jgi:hypothetical protein